MEVSPINLNVKLTRLFAASVEQPPGPPRPPHPTSLPWPFRMRDGDDDDDSDDSDEPWPTPYRKRDDSGDGDGGHEGPDIEKLIESANITVNYVCRENVGGMTNRIAL